MLYFCYKIDGDIMKKMYLFFSFFLLITLVPINVSAEERVNGEYGDYDTAIDIIQESMKDYYLREDRLQYNYSRAGYGNFSPEEATYQDNKHLVCASYTYSSYVEAFGVSSSEGFPIYNYSITDAGANYYNTNKNNPAKLDGNYLLYYEKKSESIKYVYNNNESINDFIQMIQPGDLFTYTGHAMIAYAKVERSPGVWDILMLNSTGGSVMKSRIDGTSQVFHHLSPSSHGQSPTLHVDKEGTIKFFWLSESSFVKNGNINCSKEECTAIRMFYKNGNKAVFNYPISPNEYNKSLLRINYPGLFVEKTVDKIDNNSVYLNDELEYTITIKNMSNLTDHSSNYDKLYIIEELEDTVQYISSNGEKDNNKIVFTVDNLNAGQAISLKYKVKVKDNLNNLNKTITSVGKLKKSLTDEVYISTGVVENKIIPTTKRMIKSYNECYDEYSSSKSGLDLINSIYICAYGKDFHFDAFDFHNFIKNDPISAKGKKNAVVFKSNLSEDYLLYKDMILNNLWGGLVELSTNSTNDEDSNSTELDNEYQEEKYTLPRWSGDVSSTRARNISKDFFKDGDVLIYHVDYSSTKSSLKHTKEDGMYAYIYLDGRFVGINGSGETSRNEFTYDYYSINGINIKSHLYSGYDSLTDTNRDEVLSIVNYATLFDKDSYVILRPELVIKEIYNIDVSVAPTKSKYLLDEKKLELSGGELTINYNDGTFETISMENQYIDYSGFSSDKLGTKTITVEYEGYTTTFDVMVVDSLTDIVHVADTDSYGLYIVFFPIIIFITMLVTYYKIKKNN